MSQSCANYQAMASGERRYDEPQTPVSDKLRATFEQIGAKVPTIRTPEVNWSRPRPELRLFTQ